MVEQMRMSGGFGFCEPSSALFVRSGFAAWTSAALVLASTWSSPSLSLLVSLLWLFVQPNPIRLPFDSPLPSLLSPAPLDRSALMHGRKREDENSPGMTEEQRAARAAKIAKYNAAKTSMLQLVSQQGKRRAAVCALPSLPLLTRSKTNSPPPLLSFSLSVPLISTMRVRTV